MTSKYSKLLPLLQKLEEVANKHIGYDPEGYAEQQRDIELKETEEDLDGFFRAIVRHFQR